MGSKEAASKYFSVIFVFLYYKFCLILAAKPTQVQQQRKGMSYDDKLLIYTTNDQLQYMCFELNVEDLQKMVIVSVFFSIDHLGGAALHATPPYPPCPPTVI